MKFCTRLLILLAMALVFLESSSVFAQGNKARTLEFLREWEDDAADADSGIVLANDDEVAPLPKSSYAESGSCGCNSCREYDGLCLPYADRCPRVGLYAFGGIESFRGVSDGLTNNNGAVAGVNMGAPLPVLKDYGFGWQLGTSFGVYDWMGRATNGSDEDNRAQKQMFVTTGVFNRADEQCGWSGGIVYDWMINDNFGTLSMEPHLGQWRTQVAYAFSGKNEIGVWGALRSHGKTQDYFISALPITYEPIGQINFFWHHKLSEYGSDCWLWLGIPSQKRINQAFGGVLDDLIIGAAAEVPMSDRLSLSGNFQYAKAASSQGVLGSLEDSFDLSVSLVFYPGKCAKSRTVAGRTWMPLMPIANNGSFMVDRTP